MCKNTQVQRETLLSWLDLCHWGLHRPLGRRQDRWCQFYVAQCFVCVCVCVCTQEPVKAWGQTLMLSLSFHPLSCLRYGLSLTWNSPMELCRLVASPRICLYSVSSAGLWTYIITFRHLPFETRSHYILPTGLEFYPDRLAFNSRDPPASEVRGLRREQLCPLLFCYF